MTRYPYRYRPPARFRYPYRYRRSGGGEKAIGLALGAVLASGLSGGAVVTVIHHAGQHRHSPSAPAPVASGSEIAFMSAVLADLSAPDTSADITSIEAWVRHETPWPPVAADNPMNSTMPMPGSTVYNSVGVQNYPTASEGAQATALTLANGNYPLIVAALKSGNGLCGNTALAAEFLTWSGSGYSGVC